MKKKAGIGATMLAVAGLSFLGASKKNEEQSVAQTPAPTPHVAVDERKAMDIDDDLVLSHEIRDAFIEALAKENTANSLTKPQQLEASPQIEPMEAFKQLSSAEKAGITEELASFLTPDQLENIKESIPAYEAANTLVKQTIGDFRKDQRIYGNNEQAFDIMAEKSARIQNILLSGEMGGQLNEQELQDLDALRNFNIPEGAHEKTMALYIATMDEVLTQTQNALEQGETLRSFKEIYNSIDEDMNLNEENRTAFIIQKEYPELQENLTQAIKTEKELSLGE